MSSVARQRKKDLREANSKLDDLVLKHRLLERSKNRYKKDIEKASCKIDKLTKKKGSNRVACKIESLKNNIDYDMKKIEFLIRKQEEVKKGIKKWNEQRELCR